MKQNGVTKFVSKLFDTGKKNSAAILAGTAIVGVIATTWTMYHAAPKADEIIRIRKKKLEHEIDKNDKAARKEVIKKTVIDLVPIMAPPVLIGGATIAAIAGSQSINSKRIAVATAAYNLADASVKELNKQLKTVVGDKKAQDIKEAIAKDKFKADKDPIDTSKIIVTGTGDVLCKDLMSGRFFKSNAEKIRQTVVELSADCQSEMWVTLNELYSALKIEQIPLGDDLGWNVDDLERGLIPVTLTSLLSDDGTPCIALDYDVHMINSRMR